MKRKYTKRKCSYWGHQFIPLGVSNRLKGGGKIRFCNRCQKHFVGTGLLSEELQDLVETTLKDLPRMNWEAPDLSKAEWWKWRGAFKNIKK